jgi:LCP family protein required for cell wall assembly
MARAPKKRANRMDNVTRGLLVAFAVVGILLAFIGGKFVFNLVKGWKMTSLPGAPVATEVAANSNATQAPAQNLQTSSGSSSKPWDGKGRVNILLLGLDTSSTSTSADRQGPARSDTMILVTVDPLSQTIGAMSIRRDLLVNIPEGVGEKKINMAYYYGEAWKLPDGGPGLATETVEQFLGININYYAQVNFDAFVKVIDEVGGIKVDIDHEMTADWNNNGMPFTIEPGTYTLPGTYALAFARCREGCGDDFGRGENQMKMLTSLRERIMDFNMLPTLIAKGPALYNDVSSGIKTNMSFNEAVQLATLMMQIPKANMNTYNIGTDAISAQTTAIIDGAAQQVLIPNMEKIRVIRDQMFTTSGVSTAAIELGTSDALTLAKQEKARVQVLNGTHTANLAETTGTYLTNQGLNIVGTGNTDSVSTTNIVVSGATPYTVSYLATLMNVSENNIVNHYDPNASADITIYLGDDWANSNPLGGQ